MNHRVYDGWRDGKPVKLKVCRICREEKVCEDGPGSEFAISKRREGYSVVWNPHCKVCKNRSHKERMETDPEYAERIRTRQAENTRRWMKNPENREKARASWRRYHQRIKQEDPERILEAARMGYVLRRERQGKVVRHRQTVIDGTTPRVQLGPFREWLGSWMNMVEGDAVAEAERVLGIPQRTLYRYLHTNQPFVALDVVDRAILYAQVPVRVGGREVVRLDDLYPFDGKRAPKRPSKRVESIEEYRERKRAKKLARSGNGEELTSAG